jgi:ribosomal protein L11 methyltransferase
MPFDDGSGHPERSRGVRAWPALEVHQANPQSGDLIQAFLLDFGVAAVDDNLPDRSRVFFHEAGDRDRAAEALCQQFPGISVRPVDVPDEDWAARSQASLHPVQVDGIVVAPPWDVPSSGIRDPGSGIRDSGAGIRNAAPIDPIVLVIQPSMGFGTGHHATTRLCLAALQRIDLHGRRVADVGTGSGVLAIAASRLGAETVVAIDDDADAVKAARENLALNPEARVDVSVVDVRSAALEPFDVVVANLTGGLLIATAARLTSLAGPSGRLVLSGLMDNEESDVLRAFSGLKVEWRGQEDEWVCLELTPDRQ